MERACLPLALPTESGLLGSLVDRQVNVAYVCVLILGVMSAGVFDRWLLPSGLYIRGARFVGGKYVG